jgi:hypothetical protein
MQYRIVRDVRFASECPLKPPLHRASAGKIAIMKETQQCTGPTGHLECVNPPASATEMLQAIVARMAQCNPEGGSGT